MYKDKEKQKEAQQRWREKNKGRRKEYQQEWRRKNKDKVKGHHRCWYLKYKTEILKRQRVKNKAIKGEVLTHYGKGKLACVICGETRLACLSIDHIVGGEGLRHRLSVGRRGSTAFYHWLKKTSFPEGYQTLCMNCQFVKAEEELERMKK